jgi:hypothetical protein
MHEHILRRLEAENLSVRAGLIPGRRPRPPLKGIVLGYDHEWQASGGHRRIANGDLLSTQLAVVRDDGSQLSRVFHADAPKLTVEGLVGVVESFVSDARLEVPARGPITVYLVAHFAGAELGMFEDALRDLKITTVGKAHFAELPEVERAGRKWRLRIVDLYAFYKRPLADVGRLVGVEKVDLPDGAIVDMASLRERQPKLYDRYAETDAIIAAVAMTRLRAKTLTTWNVDPLQYRTTPSLALAIFTFNFLGELAPVAYHLEPSTAIDRRGRRKEIAVVNNHELRRLALQAYWGGNNQAFIRGLYRRPVVEYDVNSMYPHAAILQPLPSARTRWFHWTPKRNPFDLLAAIEKLEGFMTASFKFHVECKYPCLPVALPGAEKLFFPLRGITHCTIAEVQAARRLGAEVTPLDVWAFIPGEEEVQHDLARFMRHFLDEKHAAESGSLEYEYAKLMANGIIGKFVERVETDLTTVVERRGRQAGVPGLAGLLAKSAAARGALGGPVRPGSGFAPEWAALIVGRARALMASIVADCGALCVSTDGLIAPRDPPVDLSRCSGVQALRSCGSDLKRKSNGDGLWVGKERQYAVLHRSTETGRFDAISKVASHSMRGQSEGVKLKAEEAAKRYILGCLAAEKDIGGVRTSVRLATAPEAARRGLRVNAEVVEEHRALLKWDGKRRIVDRDVNVFRSMSETKPFATVGGAAKANMQRLRRVRASIKKKRHARNVVDQVVALIQESDLSLKQIAKKTGTSKSWVHDLKRKMMRQGPLFWRPRKSAALLQERGAETAATGS